jgi:hypothetical protein
MKLNISQIFDTCRTRAVWVYRLITADVYITFSLLPRFHFEARSGLALKSTVRQTRPWQRLLCRHCTFNTPLEPLWRELISIPRKLSCGTQIFISQFVNHCGKLRNKIIWFVHWSYPTKVVCRERRYYGLIPHPPEPPPYSRLGQYESILSTEAFSCNSTLI